MPLKFNPELSAQLFRYVQSVEIKFNPFDSRAKSCRELLRSLQARRFIEHNPKFQLLIDVHNRYDTPSANVLWIDNTNDFYKTSENYAHEIMFQIHLKAMQMDAEYEMSGKSIDEN